MPLDLGHDVARLVPALRLIAEAGVIAPYLVGWSPDRSLQQISDLILEDLVGRKPDRVACTLGFKKLVDLGIGESGPANRCRPFLPVRASASLSAAVSVR